MTNKWVFARSGQSAPITGHEHDVLRCIFDASIDGRRSKKELKWVRRVREGLLFNAYKQKLIARALGKDQISLSGNDDQLLMSLGRDVEFGRGLVVGLKDDKMIQHPFYPKFANSTTDDVRRFKSSVNLEAIIKWSGHLVKVHVTREKDDAGGYIYIVWVTSKNGDDPRYVDSAKTVIESFLTDELVERMYRDNMTLSFEAMTADDMEHGYRLQRGVDAVLVCTCVASYDVNTAEISYMDLQSLHKFCIENSVPVGDSWVCNDPTKFDPLLEALTRIRDLAGYTSVVEILDKYMTKQQGTVDHAEVVDEERDIMEGLIIKATFEDGTRETIKWKLAWYALVRELREAGNLGYMDKPKKFLEHMGKFIRCTSEAAKTFLMHFARAMYVENKRATGRHFLDVAYSVLTLPDDEVMAMSSAFDTELVSILGDAARKALVLTMTVGPIGAGKSTFTAWLAERLGLSSSNIDGDYKWLLRMGRDRNQATSGLVIKRLVEKGAAFVSSGGGAIEDLMDLIVEMLGELPATSVLFVVDPNATEVRVLDDAKAAEKEIKAIYDGAREKVEAAVEYRKTAVPGWADAIPAKVADNSAKNQMFAWNLAAGVLRAYGRCIVIPGIPNGKVDEDTISQLTRLGLVDELRDAVSMAKEEADKLGPIRAVSQRRLLARVSSSVTVNGHVTLHHSGSKRALDSSMPSDAQNTEVQGVFLVLKQNGADAKKKSSSLVVIDKACETLPKGSHITVAPGSELQAKHMRDVALVVQSMETVPRKGDSFDVTIDGDRTIQFVVDEVRPVVVELGEEYSI